MFENLKKDEKIFVAGHSGMVGSAILRKLLSYNIDQENILTSNHEDLELTKQAEVNKFFQNNKIKYVFLSAAKVGGIVANNTFPAEFIFKNLMIQSNIIEAANNNGVKRLLFLGSSCIYPKNASQPISESEFLNGYLEPTNRPYAIAKISGIEMIWSYNRQYKSKKNMKSIAVMPTNLYGLNDNYDLETSHVIPGLINKIHRAKNEKSTSVTIWGTGKPLREFMFADDLAEACIYLLSLGDNDYCEIAAENRNSGLAPIINVGSGEEISIHQLATKISSVIGFSGNIKLDVSKPDGTNRKLLDSTILKKLGWTHKTDLESGLKIVYNDFLKKLNTL